MQKMHKPESVEDYVERNRSALKSLDEWVSSSPYLLLNKDEDTFIKAFVPAGEKTRVEDEFSETVAIENSANDNRAALVYAHRVLNGEIDLPVTATLRLRRYNPTNQTFLTDATLPNLR